MKKILGLALVLALVFGSVAFAFENISGNTVMLRGGNGGGGNGGNGGEGGHGGGGHGGNGGNGGDHGGKGNPDGNHPHDGSGPRRDGTGGNPLHPVNP